MNSRTGVAIPNVPTDDFGMPDVDAFFGNACTHAQSSTNSDSSIALIKGDSNGPTTPTPQTPGTPGDSSYEPTLPFSIDPTPIRGNHTDAGMEEADESIVAEGDDSEETASVHGSSPFVRARTPEPAKPPTKSPAKASPKSNARKSSRTKSPKAAAQSTISSMVEDVVLPQESKNPFTKSHLTYRTPAKSLHNRPPTEEVAIIVEPAVTQEKK